MTIKAHDELFTYYPLEESLDHVYIVALFICKDDKFSIGHNLCTISFSLILVHYFCDWFNMSHYLDAQISIIYNKVYLFSYLFIYC